MGKKLNLKKPQAFSEKLQWVKLYDRRQEYTVLVDKYAVKQYIADRIGKEYIIPTLGVWDNFEEIDFDKLPNQFVLKCTHSSGDVVICKDKSNFDIKNAKKKICGFLKKDFSRLFREWPYKNVPRRVIAEEYMEEKSTGELRDYKFFCFDGKIDSIMVCCDRRNGHAKYMFYDTEWNRLHYLQNEVFLDTELERPVNLSKMIEIVNILHKETGCSRIDMYNVDGKIYFGEFTFFNASGFDRDITYETDCLWGKKYRIREDL